MPFKFSGPLLRAHNFNLISLGFATANFTGPLLAGILLSHPGLEFLQDAPEFQERCVRGGVWAR